MTDEKQQELADEAVAPDTEFLSTGVDLRTRTIRVGDIEDGVADYFFMQMHLLIAAGTEPIHLIINSRGGCLQDALGMYDCIRTAGCQVVCEVYAHCMSAAVLLAAACDVRLIHRHALVMVHNPTHGHEGDSFSIETWGRRAKKDREHIYRILGERSHKPAAHWRRKCVRGDYVIEADKAVELGLFDTVIDYD